MPTAQKKQTKKTRLLCSLNSTTVDTHNTCRRLNPPREVSSIYPEYTADLGCLALLRFSACCFCLFSQLGPALWRERAAAAAASLAAGTNALARRAPADVYLYPHRTHT